MLRAARSSRGRILALPPIAARTDRGCLSRSASEDESPSQNEMCSLGATPRLRQPRSGLGGSGVAGRGRHNRGPAAVPR